MFQVSKTIAKQHYHISLLFTHMANLIHEIGLWILLLNISFRNKFQERWIYSEYVSSFRIVIFAITVDMAKWALWC